MRFFVKVFIIVICFNGCKDDNYTWHTIKVTATAYNSHAYQTSTEPNIAAWGDRLVPGEKCIAVSRDLIRKGLRHNTPVKIKGLKGTYLVKDKMNARWQNRIDIYLGTDIKAAKKWGRKKVVITYGVLNKKGQQN